MRAELDRDLVTTSNTATQASDSSPRVGPLRHRHRDPRPTRRLPQRRLRRQPRPVRPPPTAATQAPHRRLDQRSITRSPHTEQLTRSCLKVLDRFSRYLDILGQLAPPGDQLIQQALDQPTAEAVLADDAWPALERRIHHLAIHNDSPAALLQQAADKGAVVGAESPAAVLHHRLQPPRSGRVPPPPTRGEAQLVRYAQQLHTELTGHSSPPVQRARAAHLPIRPAHRRHPGM